MKSPKKSLDDVGNKAVVPTQNRSRRKRYSGRYPRKFDEKYKEHLAENYPSDIEKIVQRGATPIGTHRPILVNEVLTILELKPGDVVLDATFGFGGHAEFILRSVLPGGRLVALDRDPIERLKSQTRLRAKGFDENQLTTLGCNFSEIKAELLPQTFDAVIADLGVSSMQIDQPNRGFSFKIDSPWDLRMDPTKGRPARDVIKNLKVDELERILREFSDEPHARQIAQSLAQLKPQTTFEARDAVRIGLKGLPQHIAKAEGDKPVRRVFQAIRILINDELQSLAKFLLDLPTILNPGGRVAILSFHSGEDRLVKKSFKQGVRYGVYGVEGGPMRPHFVEQRDNSRSKSAKLRWAKKA